MIEIKNCIRKELNLLKHDIERFRTIRKSAYNSDEFFESNDGKLLILCHTINEGSNGAYYFQQVIIENNPKQKVIINLSNFWTPLWAKNFEYDSKTKTYLTSVTCYHKETNSNPMPQLILDIDQKAFFMKSKDLKIDLSKEMEEKQDWTTWNKNKNICETYREKYDM